MPVSAQAPATAIRALDHPKLKGGETVTMVFPHSVNLLLGTTLVRFEEGPQEVPVSLKDHWYLRANGVKMYKPRDPAPKAAATPQPVVEDEDTEEDSTGSGEVETEPASEEETSTKSEPTTQSKKTWGKGKK